jgi:hypothetical protein
MFLVGAICLSAAGAEIPSIIASGFDAYKSSGSKAALATWLRGAQPSAGINTSGMPPDVGPGTEAPDAFGPMDSYEVIAMYSPSSRVRRVYAVAYFPQGPLFCCFDLFKVSGAWTTYGLKFSLSPEQMLPVELLEKTG